MDRICTEVGSVMFLLTPSNTQWTTPYQLEARAALTTQPENPLSGVPQEYHKFSNIFSGEKANTLAPHQPYNLKINLGEGAKPLHGPIYSFSPPELTALREFLEENTKNGFICLSWYASSAHPQPSPIIPNSTCLHSSVTLMHAA